MYKFTIVRNNLGQYHARFIYDGKIIFWTENYVSEQNAINAINSIQINGPKSQIFRDNY